MRDRVEAGARAIVDRAGRWRRERTGTALAEGAAPAPDGAATLGTTTDRFHALNHALRTVALEQAPKGARRVASIGASGTWYFDWFEACVGPVDEHLGVEAFEAQPDDLPAYVRWVTDTADHLDSLPDGSVDMVFAGQTTEHLWEHELSGFVLEAHRVLSVGGWLVADSPNRLVTEHLAWSHGGHTVELTPSEFGEVLELAGFRVGRSEGLWRCRFGDEVLQLEDELADEITTVRRIVTAAPEPDESFVWWIEAERLDREPDVEAVQRRVREIYEANWNTRVCRGMWPGPGAGVLPITAADRGLVAASLPFPLHAGRWRLTIKLAAGSADDARDVTVRLVAPGDFVAAELSGADAELDGQRMAWTFDQPFLLFALSLELHVGDGTGEVSLVMPWDLRLAPAT
jgi:SAM-dependent methyltransferase